MEFVLVIVIVGLAVSAWVAIMMIRNQHATYDDTHDRPRRRRSRRRRRRRRSSGEE
jgi:uncharacterized BrkB/YihY/UPF0761 family membrane protein